MFLKSVIFCLIFEILGSLGDELVGTVIVFRHGARAPRLFHPNDPYKNVSFWPVPVGELTEEGKIQAYELGKWARHRYSDLLLEKYASKDFFIYSSGLDRTLMSASLFAAGLYPPIPSSSLPNQPIPIHSKPPHLDSTILSDQPCPKREYLIEKILESDFAKNIDKDNEEVYNYLSAHMGMPVTTFKGLEAYYDTFFIEERNHLTLPNWTEKVYPDKLRELALYNLVARTRGLESTRFRVGSLFSEILAYLTSFTNGHQEFSSDFKMGEKGRKMLAISGHDINIADLLSVLKVPLDFWPSYSSSVIFELKKKKDSELFVSVFYKNVTGLASINIKECGLECELDKFVDFVKPVVMDPTDWKHQCVSGKFSSHMEDVPESERYI